MRKKYEKDIEEFSIYRNSVTKKIKFKIKKLQYLQAMLAVYSICIYKFYVVELSFSGAKQPKDH